MATYQIGDVDEYGYCLRRQRGPIQLWETRKGNFVIYLSVSNKGDLFVFRKYHDDANALFDDVCLLLPNLEPEL